MFSPIQQTNKRTLINLSNQTLFFYWKSWRNLRSFAQYPASTFKLCFAHGNPGKPDVLRKVSNADHRVWPSQANHIRLILCEHQITIKWQTFDLSRTQTANGWETRSFRTKQSPLHSYHNRHAIRRTVIYCHKFGLCSFFISAKVVFYND